MTSRAPRPPVLVAVPAALALTAGLLVPAPALADHTDPPATVTLAGSFQSELGCPGDWQPECAATQLSDPDDDGTWTATFELPAGSWEYKVAIDGSWDENYGPNGTPNSPDNIAFTTDAAGEVSFSYDEASHVATQETGAGGGLDPALLEMTQPSLRQDLTDEVFYFVLPDRFHDADPTNNRGDVGGDDPLEHGYDPTDEGFFHGGDLAGLLDKMDYLEGMGVTAIWMAPVFKNKPVQGIGTNDVSAGYHGYWTLDYSQIDPHFGTNEELEALIDEAHSRDMKVFFDIITNHTADVIQYQEGVYDYIAKASEPYRDADGEPFDDREYATSEDFPALDPEVSFPYTPVVPEDEADVKVPAWLNDVRYYHNRGNSSFAGENSVYGDFFGLDDLFTEHPDVVDGMIEIFEPWVDRGVDGFRIDTMKHVNVEFWQQWSPAIETYAKETVGNEDFFMFGEVFSANEELLSMFPTKGDVPAVLDFGFQDAATNYAARNASAQTLRDFFAADDYYIDADGNAYSLPTFLGNHDMGRIGTFIAQGNPGASDEEMLARDRLAHALMYFSRGMPVVYSGDEQGFTGSGGDKAARQDMFPSVTDIYLDDDQIGTDATAADDNFDTTHPLYETLGDLATLTGEHEALRSGAQLPRFAADGPGVFAFSRVDRDERVEYLVAVNNAEAASEATFATGTPGATFSPLWSVDGSAGDLTAGGDGDVTVSLPAFGAAVYRADTALPASDSAPGITVAQSGEIDFDLDGQTREALVYTASLDRDLYAEVSFMTRVGGGEWTYAGTDDNFPYRITVDTEQLDAGTTVEVAAVVDDLAGHKAGATTSSVVVEEPAEPVGGLQDHLIVHFPETENIEDLSIWAFGDIADGQMNGREWPNGLEWNGEDDYGVFRFIEADTTDGANQEIGLIVVDSAGNKVGTQDDRFVDPSLTPEVWLSPDSGEVFTSEAAAQGFATVHYRRPDGNYDGWGLHLWGDALAEGVATEWTAPREPDGISEQFGAYWNVPVDDVGAALNFIIHKGDEKDPGPDQSIVPSQTPDAYVVSGDETIHESRSAALGLATIHYHRPDGDYGDYSSSDFADYWSLYTWTGAANPSPSWQGSAKPTGSDRFGQVWEVPLAEGATSLNYILHRGDTKDLPEDQVLDLVTVGNEVWVLAGREGYLLPVQGGGGEPGDLTTEEVVWLTEDVIAWDVDDESATYSLHTSPDGGLELVTGGVDGPDGTASVELEWLSADLPADLAERFPHLAGYAALGVPDDLDVAEALKGALAVSSSRGDARTGATGVQVPGVLDDLYADAARDADLGVTWDGDVPTISLWAPTARSVTLHRFDDPSAAPPGATTEMTLDEASGVWSVTGEPGWDRQYYLFEVEVYVPSTDTVESNVVTDPYSVSLATNSVKSQIVSLDDADLAPEGWADVATQAPPTPEQIDLYELHVRDFSISDETVPEEQRGTYKAFTQAGSDGMTHLRELAEAGLTTVHLLPTFDIATIEEDASERVEPDVPDAGSASPEQQEAVLEVADSDGFNWGYDPFHYNAPEGSYSTDPEGTTRIVEFREMVQALNATDLGVVLDVVYNHTAASGQAEKSVLDKVVPGYYHRLLADGTIATSTCCANTATEHAMMEKLMVDSVVLWAKEYKVDGFRFDLMGHHSKANMLAVREALDSLTLEADGVDGKSIYVYGEGWNFGEVADDARFVQATQLNMGGTGIGTFNDRLRDAVRGGGPFDENPRVQGFGSGLLTDPNGDAVNGDEAAQREALLLDMDQIKVGMAGNLADFTFVDRNGDTVTGAEVDYNGSPTGYTQDPQENIVYVSAHDNETLYDSHAFKLPQGTSMADRVRMQQLALSTVALSQGVSFFHAGTDMLRSKSLDRNSYNSGDHFNVLDFSYATNNFGVGLPPAPDNEDKWPFMAPLLADPALQPSQADIEASVARFRDLLAVADSSPLFSLTTEDQVQEKLSYLDGSEVPGLILMHLDDTVGEDVDAAHERVVVAFNATDEAQTYSVDALAEAGLVLHPIQAAGADPVVKEASFDGGTFTVPARTTAVFVEPTPPATLTVEVQARPGGGQAVVNPRSRGHLPFVVLSQDGFDPVADTDVDSLRVGVTGEEDSVVSCEAGEDWNGDGVVDLLCKVQVRATGVEPGSTELLLRGSTVDGDLLEGTATIRTVGPSADKGGNGKGGGNAKGKPGRG
ncbi:pullulanase-type alpha-1,6-glucosidase [Aquipuribacter sp. SD81]|uniref:pullulanase-type alpha-1,6-glucosidase n=1 Tax=Aquipuribacter sp. SD81 TaxID=3127703 RepID=UPI00301AC0A1